MNRPLSGSVQVFVIGRVAERFGEGAMVAIGLLTTAIALGALALTDAIPLSLLGVTALVIGMAPLRPAVAAEEPLADEQRLAADSMHPG